MTKEDIDAWFESAAVGDVFCYGVANEMKRPTKFILEHAMSYYLSGDVRLFQKRQKDGSSYYLIQKRQKHEVGTKRRNNGSLVG